MDLPFTPAEFFQVFRAYNESVWPIQWVWAGAAVAALFAARRGTRRGTRAMLLVLSALWLWMAAIYHVVFFRPINPAATLFAGLFLAQAALLFGSAIRGNVVMRPDTSWSGRLGWLIVAYALVIYPLVGAAAGHRYPANPTFGLPCPTTLYTLGVLSWLRPLRWTLFVIPLVWSVIGTGAALKLGVPQDLGLAIAAGLVSLTLIYSTGTAPRSARAM